MRCNSLGFQAVAFDRIMRFIPILLLTIAALLAAGRTWEVHAQGGPARGERLASGEQVDKGNYLLGQHKFAEAIAAYEDALRLDPTNEVARANIAIAHNNWGMHYFNRKMYKEARQEWETALKLDPYHRNASHNLRLLEETLRREGVSAVNPEPSAPGGTGQEPRQGLPAVVAPPSAIKILTPGIKVTSPATEAPVGRALEVPVKPALAGQKTDSPAGKIDSYGAGRQGSASPPSQTGSLATRLSAVEMKLYGQAQTGSVLTRLEKMEKATEGSVRGGTIRQRIDFLEKSYGL